MLVKETLSPRVQFNETMKSRVIREKPRVDYRSANRHAALASGGFRKEAQQLVQPRTAIAFSDEVVETLHRKTPT
jgi:hypothetical protein